MKLINFRLPVAFAAALMVLSAVPAEAQTVTRADIERLEVLSNEVALDVESARTIVSDGPPARRC